MADLTSVSTYRYRPANGIRRYTIDVSSAGGTTSDTVNSRLRAIEGMYASYRSTAFAASGSIHLAANGTAADNNLNILVARSSLGIAEPFTIFVEGR